ncbi:MAG: MFS transporter [Candidatus Ranarchaeia archaeon]
MKKPSDTIFSLNRDTLLMALGVMFLTLGWGISSFTLPFYFVSLNTSLSSVGFIFAFTPIVFGIFRYIFGTIGDMLDRKKFLWLSATIQAGTLFAYPFVRGIPSFATLSVLRGVSSSLRSGSVTPLLLICNPPEKRGTALALNMSSISGGAALGYFIAGFLLPNFGYFWTFSVGGFSALIGFIFFIQVKAKCDVVSKRRPLREMFSMSGFDRNIIIMLIAFAISGAAVNLGQSFALPLTLQNEFSVPLELIGFLIAISWVLQSLPGFIAPSYNDKYNPKWLSGVMSILCFGCFIGMFLTSSLEIFIGLYFVYSLLLAIVLNNRWTVIGNSTRERKTGHDVAFPSIGFGIGAFIGSYLAGIIAEIFGYKMLYGLEGILWLLHAFLIMFFIIGSPSLKEIRIKKEI